MILPPASLLRHPRDCPGGGFSSGGKPGLVASKALELFGCEGSKVIIKQLLSMDAVHFPSPAFLITAPSPGFFSFE